MEGKKTQKMSKEEKKRLVMKYLGAKLEKAVQINDVKEVKELIKRGASVEDSYALHWANHLGNIEMLEILSP